MQSRGLVLAGCLGVAVLAGCSSSGSTPTSATTPMSAAAYKQALHRVAVEEAHAQQTVNAGLHAKKVLTLRTALTKFEADQTAVAAQLSTLHPPTNAVAANAALAKAFGDNASGIHALLQKIDHAKTVKKAMRLIQSDKGAQRAGQEIDAALKKLKQLGYTSGS